MNKLVLKTDDVAQKFGRSKPWFYAHQNRLNQIGFPKKDKELGGWLANQVDNWFDQRANRKQSSSEDELALEAIRGKNNAAVRPTV